MILSSLNESQNKGQQYLNTAKSSTNRHKSHSAKHSTTNYQTFKETGKYSEWPRD